MTSKKWNKWKGAAQEGRQASNKGCRSNGLRIHCNHSTPRNTNDSNDGRDDPRPYENFQLATNRQDSPPTSTIDDSISRPPFPIPSIPPTPLDPLRVGLSQEITLLPHRVGTRAPFFQDIASILPSADFQLPFVVRPSSGQSRVFGTAS